MNIIIPLAGSGRRFKEDGYTRPKPLISVMGEPLIVQVVRSIQIQEDDRIFIVYNKEMDAYQLPAIVKKALPETDITFIPISYKTRGATETVLCGLQQVPELHQKTMVVDGDTLYESDIVTLAKQYAHNAIFYFKDKGLDPIYSYIDIDDEGRVKTIKEKERISSFACTGAYVFESGTVLRNFCEDALEKEDKSCGEYYISNLYAAMLRLNYSIKTIRVENFHCLGTPHQLKTYCLDNDGLAPKKRFCFDLDGTLCTYPHIDGDYSTVTPIQRNIARLKYLYSLRHTIIIQTARGMKSSDHNPGRAHMRTHKEVFSFLEKYDIPYDEIYFGKPQADFYIDDLAVRAFDDVEKEIGFYDAKVEPRSFNKVEFDAEIGCVIKTTANKGEIYWYKNIPSSVKVHFPESYHIDGNKIYIEKIVGTPLSYIFINGSLTTADIDLIFQTMDKIHNGVSIPSELDLYGNYSQKLLDRHSNFKYQNIDGQADEYYMLLLTKLNKYQSLNLAIPGVIHGDMVFSNIFLCDNRLLRFIDMRGKVGDIETIFGDAMYDYAKVYQSLCGYDNVLCDVEIKIEYNTSLLRYFEQSFINKFGDERFEWLRTITASLFFSLIPLHTDIEKQKKYFGLMKSLL